MSFHWLSSATTSLFDLGFSKIFFWIVWREIGNINILKTRCQIPIKNGVTLPTVKELSKQNKKVYVERNDFEDV